MPLTLSSLECISITLLHSNANDFHSRFHKVDSEVAHAAGKIIRMMLFALLKNIFEMWGELWNGDSEPYAQQAHPQYARCQLI